MTASTTRKRGHTAGTPPSEKGHRLKRLFQTFVSRIFLVFFSGAKSRAQEKERASQSKKWDF